MSLAPDATIESRPHFRRSFIVHAPVEEAFPFSIRESGLSNRWRHLVQPMRKLKCASVGFPKMREQHINVSGTMCWQAGEHVLQIGVGIVPVQLG
ncbi:hypothetical protein AN416_38310 (plasmid) [Paraburkholderia caribensis]|nr:hypothetical protein AN416_38310 [Paraburkholderia caribensis]